MDKILSEKEIRVVRAYINWEKEEGEECWLGYKRLSEDTNIPIKDLRKTMKNFVKEKMASYCHLIQQGKCWGKGYLIFQWVVEEFYE